MLYVTVLIVLGLWVRTLITGQDIPSNWAILLGGAWGGLLGLEKLIKERKEERERGE